MRGLKTGGNPREPNVGFGVFGPQRGALPIAARRRGFFCHDAKRTNKCGHPKFRTPLGLQRAQNLLGGLAAGASLAKSHQEKLAPKGLPPKRGRRAGPDISSQPRRAEWRARVRLILVFVWRPDGMLGGRDQECGDAPVIAPCACSCLLAIGRRGPRTDTVSAKRHGSSPIVADLLDCFAQCLAHICLARAGPTRIGKQCSGSMPSQHRWPVPVSPVGVKIFEALR